MTPGDRNPYDPVPHSHVVPAGYLRAWAHEKQIAMRRVGAAGTWLIGVRDAGVRKNFYRRERPDTGEAIYDVEWSLRQAETAALPVVVNLPARWPLDLEDKAKLGQFFALQHLRGAAFRRWHEAQIGSVLQDIRADPDAALQPHPGRTAQEVIGDLEAALTSATYRLIKMLKLVRSVGILFASMHWALIEFGRGSLVTSDHPVVAWPLAARKRTPAPNDLNAGVVKTLEVFVPIAPAHLLLMTWRDEKSTVGPVAGLGRHLATANAFVAANADVQWFHEPGVDPWIPRGRRPPLAPELLAGYGVTEVTRSRRRATAQQLADAETRRDLSNDPVEIVSEDGLPDPRERR